MFVNLSDNQRELEHEKTCRNGCNRQNCLVVYYESFNFTDGNSQETALSRYEINFRASYSIDGIDYYLQLFGLIVLFLNISLAQTLPALFRMAGAEIVRLFNLRLIRFARTIGGLKVAVTLLSACLMCLLSCLVVEQFWQELHHPANRSFYLTDPKTFQISIVLCAPIQLLIQNASTELTQSNEDVCIVSRVFWPTIRA